MPSVPYWRLSAFYFFYFAVLGGFMPYWGLYLQALSFSAADIGRLTALTMITRILAPNFWGYVADRTGKRLQLVQLGAFLVLFFWIGIFWAQHFWAIALVLLGYSFFQNAILAQFEAVTVAHLGEQREHYSRIRLWGSLGFIATVFGCGVLFDYVAVSALPVVLLLCAAVTWLSSLLIPDIATGQRHAVAYSLWSVLRRPVVWGFLLANFLMQLSHAPLYTFFNIFLEEHGYSRTAMGSLWALGVMAEVLVFTQMHRVLPRWGEQKVLLGSLLIAALRWLMIGFGVSQPWLLGCAQLLHAVSFATFHAAAISLIYREFGPGHQGQGQALYSMLWGAGVALGAWWSGLVWSSVGPEWIFAAGSVVCVLGALVQHATAQKNASEY